MVKYLRSQITPVIRIRSYDLLCTSPALQSAGRIEWYCWGLNLHHVSYTLVTKDLWTCKSVKLHSTRRFGDYVFYPKVLVCIFPFSDLDFNLKAVKKREGEKRGLFLIQKSYLVQCFKLTKYKCKRARCACNFQILKVVVFE